MAPTEKSTLFTPVTIRGVTFKNRIGVPAMGMCSAEDGFANDFHLVHYGVFAIGGAGLVILEATGVEPRGRITRNCLGIWKDEHVEPLARISKFIKSQGVVPGIQLAHSGRKGSSQSPSVGRGGIEDKDGGWPTIAPSAIPFGGVHNKVPEVATLEDIDQIKEAFFTGAKRAVGAGFELLELHFAHGYLVSSFLSPISNQRSDEYGGSLENRMRLALEIAEGVRKSIPEEVVLAVRVSVTDYCENGWTVDDTILLAKKLKTLGVDLIDCSSGGVSSTSSLNPYESGTIQVNAAKRVQEEAGIATCAVGQIIRPLKAEEIVRNEGAVIVLLGRMFLNNPHWPFHAADLLDGGHVFKYPDQYDWCIGWQAFGKWRKLLHVDNN